MSKGRDILDYLEDAVNAMEKAELFIAEMSYEEKEFKNYDLNKGSSLRFR
jgi:hypothetical protein